MTPLGRLKASGSRISRKKGALLQGILGLILPRNAVWLKSIGFRRRSGLGGRPKLGLKEVKCMCAKFYQGSFKGLPPDLISLQAGGDHRPILI